MGLDMYLHKRIYVGANYEHNNVTGTVEIYKDGKVMDIPLKKIVSIKLDCAYWRKANHIHKWFVENVQDNNDDCEEYYVSVDKIRELVSTCQKVLDNHLLASTLLPTTKGFFFGGTDYDEYYYEDIKDTVEMLTTALEQDILFAEYVYQSSW